MQIHLDSATSSSSLQQSQQELILNRNDDVFGKPFWNPLEASNCKKTWPEMTIYLLKRILLQSYNVPFLLQNIFVSK